MTPEEGQIKESGSKFYRKEQMANREKENRILKRSYDGPGKMRFERFKTLNGNVMNDSKRDKIVQN